MTTSWQCFAVYSTRRNSSFLTERSSMSCRKPFITPPLTDPSPTHPATDRDGRRQPRRRFTVCRARSRSSIVNDLQTGRVHVEDAAVIFNEATPLELAHERVHT